MNNSITLIGHVGKDPIVTTFPDTGNKVVKFSIAVQDYYSKKDEAEPMWLEVDAWNGLAERVEKTITKGREVVIHGRLSLNVWHKKYNGEDVKFTKPVIKLTSFHLCGKKPISQEDVVSDETDEAIA